MTSEQFYIIVISAVVGALTRELVSWIIKKSQNSVNPETKNIIRSIFNKRLFILLVDLVVMMLIIDSLLNLYQSKEPITRIEVFAIVIVFGIGIFFFYKSADDLKSWAEYGQKRLRGK